MREQKSKQTKKPRYIARVNELRTVIKRAHQTSINVEVRVDFDGSNTKTQTLEQGASARCNDTLTDTGNDTSRDDDIFCHDDMSLLEKGPVQDGMPFRTERSATAPPAPQFILGEEKKKFSNAPSKLFTVTLQTTPPYISAPIICYCLLMLTPTPPYSPSLLYLP
jgi:hypothetical protein